MAEFDPQRSRFSQLKDKVIVLSGGSSGIGEALVTLAHSQGAHVFFGDISEEAGQKLTSQLAQTSSNTSGTATFVKCNVSRYSDIYSLFNAALSTHGRVDHAVACAGIVEQGGIFNADLTVETVAQSEPTTVLDVNLGGSVSFARIAVPFLRHGRSQSVVEDRSLVFVSSIAGIRDSPGMFLYQTSKQGLLGLARSMRGPVYDQFAIRTNVVCPGMTESGMTATTLIPKFCDENLNPHMGRHWQTSKHVAEHIVGLILDGQMNGKSLYIEGGRSWEFEDGLIREMPNWLGEEPTRMLRENVAYIKSLGGIRGDQKT